MIGGNSFFMDIGKVMETAGKFAQQKSLTDQNHDIVKGFAQRITSAWTGKDAQEFAADIPRSLLPKYVEFALAFTGIQATLTKSSETAQASDKQSSSLVKGFADQASKICNF
jgi:uncharacterized protein YukE